MHPTNEQIIERIKSVRSDDFFGAETSDLVNALDFAHAKSFLKDGVTEAEWDARPRKAPEEEAREYLSFAWTKANNQRGLSAYRSVDHMAAWLFLAGHEALIQPMREAYQYYGKPCLVLASEIFGFAWQTHDDGVWTNNEGEAGISAEEIADQVEKMRAIAAGERG